MNVLHESFFERIESFHNSFDRRGCEVGKRGGAMEIVLKIQFSSHNFFSYMEDSQWRSCCVSR